MADEDGQVRGDILGNFGEMAQKAGIRQPAYAAPKPALNSRRDEDGQLVMAKLGAWPASHVACRSAEQGDSMGDAI
jgi:hypothetical protein